MYICGRCSTYTGSLGNRGTKKHTLHVAAEYQAIYVTHGHALHARPGITSQLQCQHKICWQSSVN